MKRFKKILYVTEPGADQSGAFARAVSLAENNQADITVLDILPQINAVDATMKAEVMALHRQSIDELVAPYRQSLQLAIEIRDGKRYVEVIRAVLRDGYDLVIKCCEDVNWLQRLFGCDDMHLLRECPCPLWLMKPGESSNYARILSAVDFDPLQTDDENTALSRKILELSSSIALSDFAEWHIAHAWTAPAEEMVKNWGGKAGNASLKYIETERGRHQNGLDLLCAQTREYLGDESWTYLSPGVHLLQGTAAETIPALAEKLQADLVVMGTLSRTGLSGVFIGNTAEAILEQLQCSVLTVKPPGFISPVTLED